MNSEQRRKVRRLQENLYTIRQLAGWSADELGAYLDVTKQTIYNLERGKPEMSLVQYLAIRKIIDDEMILQPDNKALKGAVALLLDNDEISISELQALQEALKTVTKGMSRSENKEAGLRVATQLIGPIASIAAGVAAGVLTKNPVLGITTWSATMRSLSEEWLKKNENTGC